MMQSLLVQRHKLSNAGRLAFSVAVRRSAILWQTVCEIQRMNSPVLDVS